MSTHPLIARLEQADCHVLGGTALDRFIAGPGLRAVLITGEVEKRPEALDVAVVLKELLDRYGPALRAAVADRAAEPALQAAHRAPVVPTLLLLRDGEAVAKLPRIRDWTDYLAAIDGALSPQAA
jgi:hydrogenase-1 operon protein HyaE